MHALIKAALGVALMALAGASSLRGRARSAPTAAPPSATAAPAPELVEMPCPARHLPEGEACVPLPTSAPESGPGAFRDRRPRGPSFEVIPRRPDRPADPAAFRFPIEGEPLVLRGFDDGGNEDESPVSVELSAERGTTVLALALEQQVGKAKVVAAGRKTGNTLVTAHVVQGENVKRTYLLVHGHLDAFAADASVQAERAAGDALGFVGDSGSPGFVSLYLEARLLRDDVELASLDLKQLLDASNSVPIDLRNVLPLAR